MNRMRCRIRNDIYNFSPTVWEIWVSMDLCRTKIVERKHGATYRYQTVLLRTANVLHRASWSTPAVHYTCGMTVDGKFQSYCVHIDGHENMICSWRETTIADWNLLLYYQRAYGTEKFLKTKRGWTCTVDRAFLHKTVFAPVGKGREWWLRSIGDKESETCNNAEV